MIDCQEVPVNCDDGDLLYIQNLLDFACTSDGEDTAHRLTHIKQTQDSPEVKTNSAPAQTFEHELCHQQSWASELINLREDYRDKRHSEADSFDEYTTLIALEHGCLDVVNHGESASSSMADLKEGSDANMSVEELPSGFLDFTSCREEPVTKIPLSHFVKEDLKMTITSRRKSRGLADINPNSLHARTTPMIDENNDERKMLLRERNKIAAKKSRLKKKRALEELKTNSEELEEENSKLSTEYNSLRNELRFLRQLYNNHLPRCKMQGSCR